MLLLLSPAGLTESNIPQSLMNQSPATVNACLEQDQMDGYNGAVFIGGNQ
jgi:hypothetical protein